MHQPTLHRREKLELPTPTPSSLHFIYKGPCSPTHCLLLCTFLSGKSTCLHPKLTSACDTVPLWWVIPLCRILFPHGSCSELRSSLASSMKPPSSNLSKECRPMTTVSFSHHFGWFLIGLLGLQMRKHILFSKWIFLEIFIFIIILNKIVMNFTVESLESRNTYKEEHTNYQYST